MKQIKNSEPKFKQRTLGGSWLGYYFSLDAKTQFDRYFKRRKNVIGFRTVKLVKGAASEN